MIVEDEADIGTILTQMLSNQYEVVWAANGLEALERLNWYEPDLTIMDLMMPVLNGIDTTRAIKKDNEFAAMPVLFLTARKDNDSVREAMLAGGDIYLEKPFDPPELFVRMQEMITKNAVKPRPKRFTLQQIRDHFDGAADMPAPTIAVEEPVRMSLTEQLARAAAVPRARVMAVIGSTDLLELLRRSLRRTYEFIGVSDAEAALDKISAYQPDVLIVEIDGNAISGLLLAQVMRVNRHFRVPETILLSQQDDPSQRADAQRLGVRIVTWDGNDTDNVVDSLRDITSESSFQRQRKRLEYREILRREEPEDEEL